MEAILSQLADVEPLESRAKWLELDALLELLELLVLLGGLLGGGVGGGIGW